MTADPVIEIDAAVVAHHRARVLDAISLRVQPGEVVGIIGPNGAGKTTLLTMINGLAPLASGRVRVLGLEPFNGEGHNVRRRVAYVSQVRHIDVRVPLNVRDTVMAGRAGRLGLLRRPRKDDLARVENALDAVGAGHLALRPIGHLSGGEYQKVALARALAQEPDIFLFDEPTASIDPRAQQDLLALIDRVHEQTRAAMLYVTHHVRLEDGHAALPECCSRLLMMRHGKVWRDGPRSALMDDALIRELYNCCTEAAPMCAPHNEF